MKNIRQIYFFLLHVLFFVLIITGIFWIKWYWILLLLLVLRFQDKLLGGCILTKWQFGSYDRRWTEYYLIKATKISTKYWGLIIDWLIPIIIILIAYLVQK